MHLREETAARHGGGPSNRAVSRSSGAPRRARRWMVRAFRIIARRRLRRNFRAVRVAHMERVSALDKDTALIVYLNHPSWWDPLMSFVLAPHMIGRRAFYAPMETESLKRYQLFTRLGLFPVEVDTPRGAAQFLRGAETVLGRGDVLGVTAQGGFTDARVRPPGLKPGVAALVARMERSGKPVIVLPLALEYTFWNQRLPEALACVGEPVIVPGRSQGRAAQESRPARSNAEATAHWAALLEKQLSQTQDELAELAKLREENRFTTVLRGRRGTAGVYGWWQRLIRAVRGHGIADLDHHSHSGTEHAGRLPDAND